MDAVTMNIVTKEQFDAMERVVSVEHLYELARDKRSVVWQRVINTPDGRLKNIWQRLPASFVINTIAFFLVKSIEYGDIRIYPKSPRIDGNTRKSRRKRD